MSSDSPIMDPNPLPSLDEGLPEPDLSQHPEVPSEIFENQDILGVIFEHLRDDESPAASRNDLLLAALTSKALLEPAMTSLWSSLDSFMPLLKLLPSFVSINNVYVFTGVIAEGYWARFDYYSRRVKSLTLARFGTLNAMINVSNHVYMRIGQVHPSSPLLPALQHLCIPDNFDQATGLCAAFLASTSSLVSVELHAQATSDPEFFAPYISFLIAEAGSTLQRLILRGNPRADSLMLLNHLPNIHVLEISFPQLSFSPDLFATLTNFEYLSDLTVDCAPPPQISQGRSVSASTTSSRLNRLNNLQITGSPTAVSHILGQLRPLNLKSIVVNARARTNSQPNPSLWLLCFIAISRSPTITSIRIADTRSCSNSLSISVIHPILLISQLEELDISVSSFTGGDNVIEEISSNLPMLKTLILPSKWDEPLLTAQSLKTLSDKCPNLIQLKIALDPSIVPSFHNNSVVVYQPPHPLKALYLHDTHTGWRSVTMTQSITISRIIDQLFPDLEFFHNYGTGSDEKCAEVEELRRAFQTIRRASLASPVATSS